MNSPRFLPLSLSLLPILALAIPAFVKADDDLPEGAKLLVEDPLDESTFGDDAGYKLREIDADLVLLAMGFTGPERAGLIDGLGVELDARGNVARDAGWATNTPDVFVCGDAGRGQSLIVWAIAEGRSCAAAVDRHLMGESDLPDPVRPTDRPLT